MTPAKPPDGDDVRRAQEAAAFRRIGRRLALSPDAQGFAWLGLMLRRAAGLSDVSERHKCVVEGGRAPRRD